jgi:UDP-glucose 4-epimerase
LQADGHEVAACSRHGAATLRVDVCDASSLGALDWQVDAVFMMAGATGTGASFANHEQFVRTNETGLLNVLECIRRSDQRPRVVFPSTRLVYKGSATPLIETDELQPRTVYATSKIAAEMHLQAYAHAFDVPFTVFRVCVPYGNAQGDRYSFGTLGNFIQQALEGGRIRLYGDGSQQRTFTHVDDVCAALVQGAVRDDFANQTFNIPGEDLSLLDAARCIATQLGADIELAPWPPFDLRIESGSTVFDGAKLRSRLPNFVTRAMTGWARSIEPRHTR